MHIPLFNVFKILHKITTNDYIENKIKNQFNFISSTYKAIIHINFFIYFFVNEDLSYIIKNKICFCKYRFELQTLSYLTMCI